MNFTEIKNPTGYHKKASGEVSFLGNTVKCEQARFDLSYKSIVSMSVSESARWADERFPKNG